jgi:hypothetical protein
VRSRPGSIMMARGRRCRLLAAIGVTMQVLISCTNKAPPIGAGLPRTFAPNSPEFDQRVKERFPVGSDEARLLLELQGEKFDIGKATGTSDPFQHTAQFESHDIACGESWTIEWNSEAGRIRGIEGKYRQSCF